jgi:predicted Zn-dependent protease
MEQAQGQAFLSAKSDYVITIEFKPMPQGYLGSATLFGDRCLVRLTERLLAENYVYPPSRRSILRELGHTVRHEIGHCFGLKHSADVNDVMYPYMEYEQLDSESILTFNDILKKWRLQN